MSQNQKKIIKQSVVYRGITILWNVEELLSEIEELKWIEYRYNNCNILSENTYKQFEISEQKFDKLKTKCLEFIKTLVEPENVLKLAKDNIQINLSGKLHKSTLNIAYDMGNIKNYNNDYNSHCYNTNGLRFKRKSHFKVNLITSNLNHQCPF